jgi:dihydroorotase
MSVGPTFDLLLQGGRVIDPGSGTDGPRDVAIRNGKIAVVQSGVLPSSAREVVDVTGKIVLRGLIDTHAHVYQYVTGRFGINPDMIGVQSGVTTLVDQGGPSCMTLPGFRHFIAEQSHSRTGWPSFPRISSEASKDTTTRICTGQTALTSRRR